MPSAKTIAKKLERARLNGTPSKLGIGGDLGDRCKAITGGAGLEERMRTV